MSPKAKINGKVQDVTEFVSDMLSEMVSVEDERCDGEGCCGHTASPDNDATIFLRLTLCYCVLSLTPLQYRKMNSMLPVVRSWIG